MSLSVIIVNYKTPVLVMDCLSSILKSPSSFFTEIIVVDNDSQDESRNIILGRFPQVRWIDMGYNAGFARANNEGIRNSKGDTVLLLNSDTVVIDTAINDCHNRLLASAHIAAGVQLLNTDGSPQISGNFFMRGGLNHLMALPYLGRAIRGVGLLLKVRKTNVPEARGEIVVDWINGAFLMVKREAIEKCGMLDEDFFLYSEEIEWCSRLSKCGSMCIYGDLHVVHLMGATTSKEFGSSDSGYTTLSDRKGLQLILSGLVRIRKQFGVSWLLFHLSAYYATIPIYLVAVLLSTITFRKHIGQKWHAWWGFAGNVIKASRYFIRIVRNRPYFYKVL